MRRFVARSRKMRLRIEQFAQLFLAISQIHQRGELRVQPLALFEMGERLLQLSLLLQVLRLSQLLAGSLAVLLRDRMRGGGNSERGKQNGNGGETSWRVTVHHDGAPAELVNFEAYRAGRARV